MILAENIVICQANCSFLARGTCVDNKDCDAGMKRVGIWDNIIWVMQGRGRRGHCSHLAKIGSTCL